MNTNVILCTCLIYKSGTVYIYINRIYLIYKADTVTLNPIMLLEPEMTSNLEILRGKRF